LLLVGINESAAQELESVVRSTVGNLVETRKATLNNYSEYSGDLYVCFSNREKEFTAQYGSEKIIAMEMRAPAAFFIQIGRIPAGEKVVIFNNSKGGADVILKFLESYQLNHVTYESVAYEEIPPEITRQKLAAARYIIGNEGYVSRGKVLYEQFGSLLRPDATVIASPPREATPESVSRLAHKVIVFAQKQSLTETVDVSSRLAQRTNLISASTHELSKISTVAAGKVAGICTNIEAKIAHVKTTQAVALALVEASDKINTITSTIKQIADQTNLLALNAAIEAARAGESGRGFAVVAQEVRKLAEQSGQNVGSIRKSIADVQGAVSKIAPAFESLISDMAVIQGDIREISAAVQEETAAIDDITNAIEEIEMISRQLADSVKRQ